MGRAAAHERQTDGDRAAVQAEHIGARGHATLPFPAEHRPGEGGGMGAAREGRLSRPLPPLSLKREEIRDGARETITSRKALKCQGPLLRQAPALPPQTL